MIKQDIVHIFRQVFDQTAKALKVKLSDTEIALELDHTDGDSVTSHPAKLVAKVTELDASDDGNVVIPAIDCSSLREIQLFVNGTGGATVEISPEDSGDFFVEYNPDNFLVARRLRVRSTDVRGDLHICGRS